MNEMRLFIRFYEQTSETPGKPAQPSDYIDPRDGNLKPVLKEPTKSGGTQVRTAGMELLL
ncbi:MAG: hypothetical protein IT558_03210 [Alphaproteobacteria bacterium]|nr:hypothetical protein [Alphaproteobacteria bacterium]